MMDQEGVVDHLDEEHSNFDHADFVDLCFVFHHCVGDMKVWCCNFVLVMLDLIGGHILVVIPLIDVELGPICLLLVEIYANYYNDQLFLEVVEVVFCSLIIYFYQKSVNQVLTV